MAHNGFNPHPVVGPDATLAVASRICIRRMFQSSPGRLTGCNSVNTHSVTAFAKFDGAITNEEMRKIFHRDLALESHASPTLRIWTHTCRSLHCISGDSVPSDAVHFF